ncbi:DNA adenine methylase [Ectothiorhodospira variabilis]|uniref:DNA adenine methylase n=1 Tax=Ectothiorhodospira variabilis TaxID=505694 RepID=UPI003B75D171
MKRPALRYHGGKWRLAPWIIRHFPRHRIYVEPFGGAASVLMQKPPSPVEVLNDLNGRIVSAFRVLRDPESAQRLSGLLALTPYAEAEYRACKAPASDPVEDARRLITLSYQAHGSTGASGGKATGWRRGDRGGRSTSARDWASLPDEVMQWCERLRGVFIEQSDALGIIERYDSPETFIQERRSGRRDLCDPAQDYCARLR